MYNLGMMSYKPVGRDREAQQAMAYIPAINVAKVGVDFTLSGQKVAMTFHFKKEGGWDIDGLEDLGAAMILWAVNELMTGISQEILLTGATAVDLTTATSPSVALPVTPPEAGGIALPSIASNAAACVTARTPQRGRSFRGRNYVPGLATDALEDAGFLTLGALSFLTSCWSELDTVEDTTSSTHGVASFQSNLAPRAAALFTPYTSYTMDQPLDSQRRRLPGRGD